MAHGRMQALVRKEMIQFLRARFMLILILYLYTAEVLMCTFAMSFDVRNLPTVFADFDGSPESRLLKENFRSSGYFNIDHETTRETEITALLDRGDALAAVIVPPEFSNRLAKGQPVSVQVLLDGSNSNAASVAQGYASRIVQEFSLAQMLARHPEVAPPIEHRPRVWYNSELKYAYFMVLSMISLAGMMVGVITAAASVVRERDYGTIEQLLVTPISPAELIAAKMLPSLTAGMLALFPSLLVASFVGVPLRGDLWLFFVVSALFLASSMSIGILIATFTETLQQALLISFLVLFPILFLSGTVVPLESMPLGLQFLAELSPLRHYIEAILGIFFKGTGLNVLWPRLVAMGMIGTALLGFSLLRFHRHFGR